MSTTKNDAPLFRALVQDADDTNRVVETNDPTWDADDAAFRRLVGARDGQRIEFHDPDFDAWVVLSDGPSQLRGQSRVRLRFVANRPTDPCELVLTEVEKWARAHRQYRFVVMPRPTGNTPLLLGIARGAGVHVNAYLHEEGVRAEFCAATLDDSAFGKKQPQNHWQRMCEWAMRKNAALKRGHFALDTDGSLAFFVAVLCPVGGTVDYGNLDVAFASLDASLAAAQRAGARNWVAGGGSEPSTELAGLVDLIRQIAQRTEAARPPPAGFEFICDRQFRMGHHNMDETVKLDTRDGAVALFGEGLRHGRRVRLRNGPLSSLFGRTQTTMTMTVVGVRHDAERNTCDIMLHPDDWHGVGVLSTGLVNLLDKVELVDEPDRVVTCEIHKNNAGLE